MLSCLRPKAGDSDETLAKKRRWLREFIDASARYAGEIFAEEERRQRVEA
jgi:hypothetical protein